MYHIPNNFDKIQVHELTNTIVYNQSLTVMKAIIDSFPEYCNLSDKKVYGLTDKETIRYVNLSYIFIKCLGRLNIKKYPITEFKDYYPENHMSFIWKLDNDRELNAHIYVKEIDVNFKEYFNISIDGEIIFRRIHLSTFLSGTDKLEIEEILEKYNLIIHEDEEIEKKNGIR